jgi:hypothetical protein
LIELSLTDTIPEIQNCLVYWETDQ